MLKQNYKVSVVIPACNEEGNIQTLYGELSSILEQYPNYEIIFVDDGSEDNSLNLIKQLHEKNTKVKFLSFSRNFGHQLALKAGIDNASGNCVISMDGDMQHPPELIPKMIDKWHEGYDVVYTVRKKNPKLSFFKKQTSVLFYKFMNFLSDVKVEEGTADFRLIDKRVADVIRNIHEPYLFLRGIIVWLGYRQYSITYSPNDRFTGKPKYSVKKMFLFAINGITSFSVKPLKLSVFIGFAISFLSTIYGIYAIAIHAFTDEAVSGWTSLIASVLFIGGLQLIMIGIIGIYLGKMFIQTKNRPDYIIKEKNC